MDLSWRILHTLPHISYSTEGSHVSNKCLTDTITLYLKESVFNRVFVNKSIHARLAKGLHELSLYLGEPRPPELLHTLKQLDIKDFINNTAFPAELPGGLSIFSGAILMPNGGTGQSGTCSSGHPTGSPTRP